jgi:serine/threonine-protein kinase
MKCRSCGTDNEEGRTACKACEAALTPPTVVVVSQGLELGTVFHDRYEVLASLGAGGMGMVYKARDHSLEEVVAIKVLRPDFAQDPRMAQRFKSEIRLARRVRHRNVCGIHDFGESGGLLYISMEFVEGVDLKRIVRKQGALPLDRAYDVTLQVAAGLQAVHEAGIVHRDLKSPNIMLEPNGSARLMDFGIAKREDAEGGVTVTGQVVGTPEYMSPEQAQGKQVDARTDVYALGIVTYEIFTGHVPFRGDTPISTILKHINDPPPLDGPPAERLPAPLRQVLRRALAKDPAERFSSARDFAEAVRGARQPSRRQQPLSTEALEATTVVAAPPARRYRKTALAAAGLVVFGLAGLGLLRFLPTSPDALPSPSPSTVVPEQGPAKLPEPEASPPTGTPRPATTATPSPRPGPATPTPAAKARARTPPTPTRAPSAPRSSPAREAAPKPTPTPPPPARQSEAPAVPKPTPTPVSGTGSLQLGVRPWAEIAIDGEVVGTTPLDKIPLSAGKHVVRLRHPGYQPVSLEIVISAEQTERLIFDFTTDGTPR